MSNNPTAHLSMAKAHFSKWLNHPGFVARVEGAGPLPPRVAWTPRNWPGRVRGSFGECRGELGDKQRKPVVYMDVGQNGRPRGPLFC